MPKQNPPTDSGSALVQSRPHPVSSTPVLRSSLTPETGSGQDTIPIGDYLAALRRYAWLIVATVSISVGMAMYRLSQEPARYLAVTSLRMVDRGLGMSGDLAGAGSQSGAPTGWSYVDPLLSQIQVLRSRAVAGMAVDSTGLRLRATDPEFPFASVGVMAAAPAAAPGDTLHLRFDDRAVHARLGAERLTAPYGRPFTLAGVTLEFRVRPRGWDQADFVILDREDAIDMVQNSIQANPREATDVVDLGYTAFDAALSRRAVNGVARAFLAFSTQAAKQDARLRRTYIEAQLGTTDSLLLRAQYELSTFRERVQAFSPREKYRLAQEDMGAMRIRREAVSSEHRLFAEMRQSLGAPSRQGSDEVAALAATPQIASNGGIVRIYEQLVKFQTSRDSVTTGPWSRAGTNPDVIRLDSLISTYRSRLVRAVEAREVSLRGELAVLDQVIAGDVASMQGLPDAESEEVRLSRQVETLQTLADDLLREQQKARIDEAVRQGNVEIVDPARGGMPVPTGSRRRISFALLVGLMLGGAGALALDRLNNSVRRREDVEQLLHVPILAVVPRVGALVRRRWLAARNPVRPAPGSELVTVADLDSAGAQAYRKLRTHLIFSHPGTPLRTMLVTSPAASEGKSTVSANLAVAYAQQQLRVVLVDADLRRSRLHNIFGCERIPGLAEVVVGQATLEEALRPTETPGLTLLPSGTLVPNVSELLGTGAMGDLLRELSERFDLVIVDTPPVLAAADAEILGVQTDAVLLVVRAGQTDRHSAQYAVQQLRAVGARIVGAVLNDPDDKIPGYGKYGYYYQYYAPK